MNDGGDEDSQSEALRLETQFYLFRSHLRKVEKAADRMAKKGGKFISKFEWKKGEGLTASFTTPDEKTSTEFAVLMSQFLLPGLRLSVERVLLMMGQLSDAEEMGEFLTEARERLAFLEEGPFKFQRDGERRGAKEIFIEMAENLLFCDDLARDEYTRKLQSDPVVGILKWTAYYDYCLRVFEVLEGANHFIEEHEFYPPHIERENHCIYCGTREGSFTNVEHVVPEALGNETLILPRGYVCDECNNRVSSLEQAFLNCLPMSLLKIFYVPYSKKGAFHSHRFPNMYIEKTSPNSFRIVGQAGPDSVPQPVKQSDGAIRFSLPVRDNKRFDPIAVARVLAKVGLGAMAMEVGREFVLDSRFGAARDFIRKGGPFANRLVMAKSVKPKMGWRIQWNVPELEGVFLECDLLGALFVLGLEPDILVPLPEALLERAIAYDLWDPSPGPHHESDAVERT